MHVLLQVDFPYHGPFGDEMTQAMDALSASIKSLALFGKFGLKIKKPKKQVGFIFLIQKKMLKLI